MVQISDVHVGSPHRRDPWPVSSVPIYLPSATTTAWTRCAARLATTKYLREPTHGEKHAGAKGTAAERRKRTE